MATDSNKIKLTDEEKHDLKSVVDHFDNEDKAVRERQIREWRRLKLFWDGFTRIYFDEVAHDWRIYDSQSVSDDTQQSYYDKSINIFKAYLESIIAALSVTVPPVKCYPDDADNTLDIQTAKTGDKIGNLIYRHNNVSLLWLHALYIYCTEGLVACYSYPKSDESYGTYEEKQNEDVTENHLITTCPLCGYQIDDTILDTFTNQVKDQFAPDNDDAPLQNIVQNKHQEVCPACAMQMDPELKQETLIVTKLIGVNTLPKSRICLEAYGGLFVKVPCYAMKQSDIPYLIFSYETHFANVIERYSDDKELYEKLRNKNTKIGGASGVWSAYEQWGRLSTQYRGEYPVNVVTVRNCWLRPAAFNILEYDKQEKFKEKYPNGCKVVLVNDEIVETCNENLDDCWTLSYNPLTDYLHHDPLGLGLVSVQEITTDLVSLTLQTIEHGIPQTFADPQVLNFKAYSEVEAVPGGIYPATPRSGKSVGEGFYEVKTATLSQEVLPFSESVQRFAQLTSGALPSLFGGQMSESKTASEYSMSRAQALQRLQNTWKIFTCWWKEIFGKVIPMFIENAQCDEQDVKKDQFGNFVNTYIRLAELEGKIGKIELEANENLPITWQQKKDVLMQLIQTNNPELLSLLGAPENLPIIREAIGLDDFYVPGEDDREKQFDEIKQLLDSEPITMPGGPIMTPMGPQMQPDQEMPSVPVDPDIDNNQIEYETCRAWLVSSDGRSAKVTNPNGYKNVLLHAKMHKQADMQQSMQQMQQQSQGQGQPQSVPETQSKEAPITGEGDVQQSQ